MKSILKTLAVALAAALFLSVPVLAQDVNVDYDHAIQFNKIKSYTYAKVQSSDPQLEPRMIAAVDRVLQGMGLHLVSKNADVSISVVEATKSAAEYSAFYGGLDGYTWKRGWGSGGFSDATSSLGQIPVGTLVIDMYSPGSHQLIWRGTANEPSASKERKTEDNVDKAVNSLFAKFPPKSGDPLAPNQVQVPDSASSKPVTGPS